MMYSYDQPLRGRDDEETFAALCGHYRHLSLSVMEELLADAVQSATFIAWVNFAVDRIFRRRREFYATQTFGSVHSAPPTWQPPKFPAFAARETSDGEDGASGLNSAGTGFPSPTAHAMPVNDWEYASPTAHAQRLGIWTWLQSLQPSPATESSSGITINQKMSSDHFLRQ